MLHRLLPPFFLLIACDPTPSEVCPLPVTGAGLPGDANGDGVTDMADAVAVHRFYFESAAPPVCEDAVMFSPRELGFPYEPPDLHAMLPFLYTGVGEPRREPVCDEEVGPDPGICGQVGWTWQVERTAAGSGTVRAEATLAIDNHSLVAGVEGWSVGITAAGCAIDAVTVDGTVAAPWRSDEEPGRVLEGFVTADLTDGAATSAVLLNWLHTTTLDPSPVPYPVLQVQVSAPAPSRGCTQCTLQTSDQVANPGLPIDGVIASAGRSYRPTPSSVSISLCAQ